MGRRVVVEAVTLASAGADEQGSVPLCPRAREWPCRPRGSARPSLSWKARPSGGRPFFLSALLTQAAVLRGGALKAVTAGSDAARQQLKKANPLPGGKKLTRERLITTIHLQVLLVPMQFSAEKDDTVREGSKDHRAEDPFRRMRFIDPCLCQENTLPSRRQSGTLMNTSPSPHHWSAYLDICAGVVSWPGALLIESALRIRCAPILVSRSLLRRSKQCRPIYSSGVKFEIGRVVFIDIISLSERSLVKLSVLTMVRGLVNLATETCQRIQRSLDYSLCTPQ